MGAVPAARRQRRGRVGGGGVLRRPSGLWEPRSDAAVVRDGPAAVVAVTASRPPAAAPLARSTPPGPPDRCSTGPTSCWAPTGPSTPLTGHLRRAEGGPGPAGPAAAAARVPERLRRTAPRGPPPAGVAPEVPRQQLAVPLESQPRPRGPADLVRRGDPMGRRPRPATCPRVRAEGRDARADLRGRAPHAPGMAHGPPLPALHALDVRRPRP